MWRRLWNILASMTVTMEALKLWYTNVMLSAKRPIEWGQIWTWNLSSVLELTCNPKQKRDKIPWRSLLHYTYSLLVSLAVRESPFSIHIVIFLDVRVYGVKPLSPIKTFFFFFYSWLFIHRSDVEHSLVTVLFENENSIIRCAFNWKLLFRTRCTNAQQLHIRLRCKMWALE